MENKILAEIGSKQITEADVQLALRNIPQEQAMYFSSPQGKEQLVEQLVNYEVFLNDAKENKLDEEEEFKVQMDRIRDEVLVQYISQKIMKEVKVDEKELEEYFNAHKGEYVTPEARNAKHILVDTEEEALNAKKEIEEGLSFEDAAAKYSTCPSKDAGGSLGFFSRGQMVPEFEDAAFAAELNTLVGPVETQFGQHLIIVEDVKSEEVKSFDEVKDQIENQLLTARQRFELANKAEALREKYGVKINK